MDESLIKAKISQGNEEAFSILYNAHVTLLYNYGRQITNQQDFIEDSIQEIFISIWKGRKNLSQVQSLKAYVMRSFRRQLIHRCQSERKKNTFYPPEHVDAMYLSAEYNWIEQEHKLIAEQKLRKAITKLSKRQREALFLIYYESLPYEQAAEVMNLTVKTVYNLVYEAIKNLKHLLISTSTLIAWLLLSF